MTGPDSALETTGPDAGNLPRSGVMPQDTWGESTVALAVRDLARELPQVPIDAIAAAASSCRRTVPAAAGAGALRHCIRRRALGLDAGVLATDSGRPRVCRDGGTREGVSSPA